MENFDHLDLLDSVHNRHYRIGKHYKVFIPLPYYRRCSEAKCLSSDKLGKEYSNV
jgi:hypothetical protein